MSASPMARQVAESRAIPIKRVLINDPSELPSHYSSTPGGTLFSTTPGGTKIVYEKAFLMNLSKSPISKTPPNFDIPDALLKGHPNPPPKKMGGLTTKSSPKKNQNYKQVTLHHKDAHEDQFEIEL